MKTTILERDNDTRKLKVRFEQDDVVHDRFVNGCYKGNTFDKAATDARIADVARGVAYKIGVGVVTNVVEQPMPEPLEAPAEPVAPTED
ncbi:hypothetical protein ACFSGX_03845 [Sphingomonas arantia]|uniref:Phage protein n=1 Tax=Sphingomonas arantia TaxID=1460676 RepID=A0ABW4TY33_9SPHN